MLVFLRKYIHLNRHVESIHKGKKPFECNVCDASFSDNGNLNRHIESVHEGKKSFKFNICDADFPRRSDLKTHILVFKWKFCIRIAIF